MSEDKNGLEDEDSIPTSTLIKAYGEFWDPDLVNWKEGQLMGKRRQSSRRPPINVYDQCGVYVLYKDYKPVYVGKADSPQSSIGLRLRVHRQSHSKGPRWNQFSWFGIFEISRADKLKLSAKKNYGSTKERLIATLEALLIVTIDPPLNRRKERFKNAVRLYQADDGKPRRIEDLLAAIEEKLDELIGSRNAGSVRAPSV